MGKLGRDLRRGKAECLCGSLCDYDDPLPFTAGCRRHTLMLAHSCVSRVLRRDMRAIIGEYRKGKGDVLIAEGTMLIRLPPKNV